MNDRDKDHDYCRAVDGVSYRIHTHHLGYLDVLTGTFLLEASPSCHVEKAYTRADLGKYVTAYASDLGDAAVIGQPVVLHAEYLRWDEEPREEVCRDLTGEFRVRPTRKYGSAGSGDQIVLGNVAARGVIEELARWETVEVLELAPDDFASMLERARVHPEYAAWDMEYGKTTLVPPPSWNPA